jgi:hypothetical protein
VRVHGPSRPELDELGDRFAELVLRAVRTATKTAARNLSVHSGPDDLGVIRHSWEAALDRDLLPALRREWVRAAGAQRERLTKALTAAGEDAEELVTDDIDGLHSLAASQYLETARNRLVGIGNETWEHARDQLVEGTQAGESITQLRDRVVGATDLAEPRATAIARTEVIGASNRSSLEQMNSFEVPDTTKTWLATEDNRTRPAHADVSGDTVDLKDSFDVDGESMDGPHDPGASPGNTVNCRCTLTYDIPDEAMTSDTVDTEDLGDDADFASAEMTSVDEWDTDALQQLDETTRDVRTYGQGDHALEDMWRQQGFDRTPALGDARALDDEIVRGGRETYRGIKGDQAATWAEQYRTGGKVYGGRGIYGNGTYFALGSEGESALDEAQLYAGRDGVVFRAVLRANAKVISYRDLMDEMAFADRIPTVLRDPGRYATARGYDAIDSGEPEHHLNVLNRSAMIVERTNT